MSQPSVVAEYTFQLAELFSQFYKKLSVFNEVDPNIRNSRLRLALATGQVINNGLWLLGIESPEKM